MTVTATQVFITTDGVYADGIYADGGAMDGSSLLLADNYLPFELTAKDYIVISNNDPVTLYQEATNLAPGYPYAYSYAETNDGDLAIVVKFYDSDDELISETDISAAATGTGTVPDGTVTTRIEFQFNQTTIADTSTFTLTALSLQTNPSVRGLYAGEINNIQVLLAVAGGNLYSINEDTQTYTPIYSGLTDMAKTTFLLFGGYLYIMNGVEYIRYDGTTVENVPDVAYAPLVGINGIPSSTFFTVNEGINLLTGQKRITSSGNGSGTRFYTAEVNIDSIDEVWVSGVQKFVTTDFSVNLGGGYITFTSGTPANGTNNVEITWTKDAGTSQEITGHRAGVVYGGQSDTRIILYGHEDYPNRMVWSSLDENGTPRGDYFEAASFNDLGGGEAITGMQKQYDRLKIFFKNKAMYSFYEAIEGTATYPVFALNESIGSEVFAETDIAENFIITYDKGLYMWKVENINDNTNAIRISEPIDYEIGGKNASLILNYRRLDELWVKVEDSVYIYNYRYQVWYKYDNIPATDWTVNPDNDTIYFCNAFSQIFKFNENLIDDNGTDIIATWETAWMDFGNPSIRKSVSHFYITTAPAPSTQFETSWTGNEEGETDVTEITNDNDTSPVTEYVDVYTQNDYLFKLKIISTEGSCILSGIQIPYTVFSNIR
jgi:hypothetical protein